MAAGDYRRHNGHQGHTKVKSKRFGRMKGRHEMAKLECPDCDDSMGMIGGVLCPTCGGTGTVRERALAAS